MSEIKRAKTNMVFSFFKQRFKREGLRQLPHKEMANNANHATRL